MSILGQKLQNMTESYNNYSDPAYESYNIDCGGSVLLEAETFDDLADIMEACYKVDCNEISHLNNIMTLKESGASDASIANAKSEYEYVHEAESKETGEGIGAKIKKLWEKFKNFLFSIGRKIRSLFEDTRKTYERYKYKIKGKSVTLQGYEYELEPTDIDDYREFLDASDLSELMKNFEGMDEEDEKKFTDKEALFARIRGCQKGSVKKKDIVFTGDTIGELIQNTMTKTDLKYTTSEITKLLNKIVEEINKQSKEAKGEELAKLQKASEMIQKTISGMNVLFSEHCKAIKEANALYKKAILMMVSGKTGEKKDKETKKENDAVEDKATDEEQTAEESYYIWD